MDESELFNMFANGTYNVENLRGKRFTVEILSGSKDLGFEGQWTKIFRHRKLTGYNRLGNAIFGEFRVFEGVWSGYQCVNLHYNSPLLSVEDYMRQTSDDTWLGVYIVGGHIKGWFRLKGVEK